jgi:hypothetical protein
MVTIQVTLPEDVLIFVEAQATQKGLAGPSEYLRSLIAVAQADQEQLELDGRFASAIRALEQGGTNPLTPQDWQRLQQRVLNRQAAPPNGVAP